MNRPTLAMILRQLMQSAAWGILSLCLVNLTAGMTGVSLGFGWLSGGFAIVFGAPGVIGLLVLNALFL